MRKIAEYDVKLDTKRRIIIRELPNFRHFHVKMFKNKNEYVIEMIPQVLVPVCQKGEN